MNNFRSNPFIKIYIYVHLCFYVIRTFLILSMNRPTIMNYYLRPSYLLFSWNKKKIESNEKKNESWIECWFWECYFIGIQKIDENCSQSSNLRKKNHMKKKVEIRNCESIELASMKQNKREKNVYVQKSKK